MTAEESAAVLNEWRRRFNAQAPSLNTPPPTEIVMTAEEYARFSEAWYVYWDALPPELRFARPDGRLQFKGAIVIMDPDITETRWICETLEGA